MPTGIHDLHSVFYSLILVASNFESKRSFHFLFFKKWIPTLSRHVVSKETVFEGAISGLRKAPRERDLENWKRITDTLWWQGDSLFKLCCTQSFCDIFLFFRGQVKKILSSIEQVIWASVFWSTDSQVWIFSWDSVF